MDTKADMDGAMVELPGGIEAIRALDSAQTEGARIEARSEQLRKKEMRHRRAMAFYDCLKFVNEAFFSVLAIALSVLLASRGAITVGTVLTAYLCFTQLTPARFGSCTAFWTNFPNAWCWQTTTSGCRTCRWISPVRMKASRGKRRKTTA